MAAPVLAGQTYDWPVLDFAFEVQYYRSLFIFKLTV